MKRLLLAACLLLISSGEAFSAMAEAPSVVLSNSVYAETWGFIQTLESSFEKARLMAQFAAILSRQRHPQAVPLFEQAHRLAREVPTGKVFLLAEIAKEMGRGGMSDKAKLLLQEAQTSVSQLPRKDWQHSALFAISGAYAHIDENEKALSLVKIIDDTSIASQAFQQLALIQIEKGQSVSLLFDNALDQAQHIEDVVLRSRALSNMAISFAKGGNMKQALALTHMIPVDGWRSAAYEGLAKTLSEQSTVSLELLQAILDGVKKVSDGSMGKDTSLKWVVQATPKLTDKGQRKNILTQAVAIARSMSYCGSDVWRILGESLGASGEWEQGLALIHDQLYGQHLAGGLAHMGLLRVQAGDKDKALALFQAAESIPPKIATADFDHLTAEGAESNAYAEQAAAYAEVAVTLPQIGYGDKAVTLFEQGLSSAAKIKLPHYQQEAVGTMAKLLLNTPSFPQQEDLLARLLKLALSFKTEDAKIELLQVVLVSIAQEN